MTFTPRQLNRATLDRQLLLRREPLAVADAVRRVVALQAQQPASPYLALWNRIAGFDPAELDAAFAGRDVVKATLVRITLHAVHAGRHRGDGLPPAGRGGVGGPGGRGPGAGRVPGRPRADRVPALRPLVGQGPAGRRGPDPALLTPAG
ncbi:DNA glycosylase AlkZ-like family protein [Micromonospora viridifaciens]|uniref:DNA glycosylase AlkZ-like family protein n=1 Tax=Micromonospora viridifaciens TaxID=1881 RepID=UPI0018D4EBAC|nr:crosslink repair DNA glycosylase YcaQ family protein [Micromonospora viridifaciens]